MIEDIDHQPTFRGDHDSKLARSVHPLQRGRQCERSHADLWEYSLNLVQDDVVDDEYDPPTTDLYASLVARVTQASMLLISL